MFYLNLPISAIAIVFVLLFLNVKSPKTTLKEKIEQLDYAYVLSHICPAGRRWFDGGTGLQ